MRGCQCGFRVEQHRSCCSQADRPDGILLQSGGCVSCFRQESKKVELCDTADIGFWSNTKSIQVQNRALVPIPITYKSSSFTFRSERAILPFTVLCFLSAMIRSVDVKYWSDTNISFGINIMSVWIDLLFLSQLNPQLNPGCSSASPPPQWTLMQCLSGSKCVQIGFFSLRNIVIVSSLENL